MHMKLSLPWTLWWWATDHAAGTSRCADHALTHSERSSTASGFFLLALGSCLHRIVILAPLPVLKLGLFRWKSGITSTLPTSGSIDALILTLQLTAMALTQFRASNLEPKKKNIYCQIFGFLTIFTNTFFEILVELLIILTHYISINS